jgi:hypothetical protein
LTEDVLLAISDIGNQSAGFTGLQQAQSLKIRFNIPTDTAMAHLRLAEHLYHRVAQAELDVTEAIAQIVSIASEIKDPIAIDDKQKDALATILSSKQDYETSDAVSVALANGPHFIGVNGSWSVKPIKIRSGDVIRVPIMSLSIVWHNSTGTRHETFLNMSETEWEEFSTKVLDFTESRRDLEEVLQERPNID